MEEICINGGRILSGEIKIQGSKNAVLPMIAASILGKGISVLQECPRISDVEQMLQILRSLGARTWWEGKDLYLDCQNAEGYILPDCYVSRMRSSVILLGPVTARNGKGQIGYPGGCVIGKRPVDLHIMVLKHMGIILEEFQRHIYTKASEIKGTKIIFPQISVGATEQAILTAVTAKGTTILENCACEPEIKWLCAFLQTMGAEIGWKDQRCLIIKGKKNLGPGKIKIPPDRIVAGTYICASAITRGKIRIMNPPIGELDAFMDVYRKMGGQYEYKSGTLLVDSTFCNRPCPHLKTNVYPGFPTDLQSQVMAVLSIAKGRSHVQETIFEDRFKAAEELNLMGASIEIASANAYINGQIKLCGARVQAKELRGGAALVLAGLAAEGKTYISGCSYIERGYENICEDLRALGAEIL